MKAPAFAKINLTLEITGKRDNGFHNLKSVMQKISLHDILDIKLNKTKKITISCNNPKVPTDSDNICWKAADLFLKKIYVNKPSKFGIKIDIQKNIPMKGGLAGGSSNAATTLLTLNKIFRDSLSKKELMNLGIKLGSDVPFFLLGENTALLEGKGEILTPLPKIDKIPLLLILPEVESCTATAYHNLDLEKLRLSGEKTNEFILKLLGGEFASEFMQNDFEATVFENLPILKKITEDLEKTNPIKAMMSGSGSTIFGVYDSVEKRDEACKKLKNLYNCIKRESL